MSEGQTLGDVLLGIETGKSFQTSETLAREDELGVLKVSAVTWSEFRPNEAKAVVEYAPAEHHRVRAGDLLISRANTRELVGAVACADKDYPYRLLSDKILRLVINPDLADKEYLMFAIRSRLARDFIENSATGTSDSMRNIGQDTIRAIPVRLPPLERQRAMAGRLRDELALIDRARVAAQAAKEELTCFGNAVIRESCDHPDADAVKLAEVLEEVARGIGSGWSGYPVLGATRDGLAPAKEPVGKAPERYKLVSPGTVFYNPMRIMIGSIAMVDNGDATGITSPDYVVLRGREGRVHSRWFYYWLRSPYGKRCIESLARGAVRERMLFNRLAEGEMVLPPYSEQKAASEVLGPIREVRAASALRLKEIALLPSRMLRLAFES